MKLRGRFQGEDEVEKLEMRTLQSSFTMYTGSICARSLEALKPQFYSTAVSRALRGPYYHELETKVPTIQLITLIGRKCKHCAYNLFSYAMHIVTGVCLVLDCGGLGPFLI